LRSSEQINHFFKIKIALLKIYDVLSKFNFTLKVYLYNIETGIMETKKDHPLESKRMTLAKVNKIFEL